MELDDMAEPLTDLQWQAHLAANRRVSAASREILRGNIYQAAMHYHRAANVPHLSTRGQVALLAVSAELLIDLYRMLRLSKPTVH